MRERPLSNLLFGLSIVVPPLVTTAVFAAPPTERAGLVAHPEVPSYSALAHGIGQYRSVQGKPFWFTLGWGDNNPARQRTLQRQPIADQGLLDCGVAEWEYSFFHLKNGQRDGAGYRHYGGYPTPPRTRQEAMGFVRNYYRRVAADAMARATPEQRRNFFSINGHYCYQHYGCEWGCNIVGSEVGENIESTQMHYAFTRGAARQYGKPWLIDFSSWFGPSIFDEDPRRNWGDNSGPTHGHSISLHLRTYYTAYMAGANIVVAEGGRQNFFRSQQPGSDGTLPLSTLGRAGATFYRFTRRHPYRGMPYAPIALVADFYHGIYPGFGAKRAWDTFPYTPGDQSLRDTLNAFFPGSLGNSEPEYMRSESQRLVASPYGDILDVLLTNAPSDRLAAYPVLILTGELTPDPAATKRLRDYVSRGGTLLVREADAGRFGVKRALPASGFAVSRLGQGNFLVFAGRKPPASVLSRIRSELIPISAMGSLETLYNRTEDGWIVTLVNNEGVAKTYNEPARTDPGKARTVELSYHGPGLVKAATLWGADADTPLPTDRIQITVPPGEVRIVRLKIGSPAVRPEAIRPRGRRRVRAAAARTVSTAPAA